MISVTACKRALAAFIPVLALSAAPAVAQDLDEMLKWSGAPIIHYKVVGDYSGEAGIVSSTNATSPGMPAAVGGAGAEVTDHIEFEFDWDQAAMTLVGTPVIRNTASQSVFLAGNPACPANELKGTFEFATLVEVKHAQVFTLVLTMKADYVGGTVRWMGEGSCGITTFLPQSDTSEQKFEVPMAMLMAMPNDGKVNKTPDGKSLIQESGAFAWIITPTIK